MDKNGQMMIRGWMLASKFSKRHQKGRFFNKDSGRIVFWCDTHLETFFWDHSIYFGNQDMACVYMHIYNIYIHIHIKCLDPFVFCFWG